MIKQFTFNKTVCIFGVGGFGREVLCCLLDCIRASSPSLSLTEIHRIARFVQDDHEITEREILGVPVIGISEFDPARYEMVVAVGSPTTRQKIVEKLPATTEYATLMHPTAVSSAWVEVGVGGIITAGTILTCNIKIGNHAHLNLHTTVGHDCAIGDYFTTAPAVNIRGACVFGDRVYFGTNASVRQGITLANDVTVGMGAVVVKDLTEPGTYVGSPARRIQK